MSMEQDISIYAEAMTKYVHITHNECKPGANDKLPENIDLPCICSYDPSDPDSACGVNSGCVNRALMMECGDECPVGGMCRNKGFQTCTYAPMRIIKTEHKGFGLQATADIPAGTFVIEYTGEVLTHAQFIKRTHEYEAQGVDHFYFMALKKGMYLDACRKGNWSRFMNHSCWPNTRLEKWHVKGTFKMGLFAVRDIEKGTELTFDYQFERYGRKAQVCYCGESNCKGVIGGERTKTISEFAEEDEEVDEMEEEESFKLAKKAKKRKVEEEEEVVQGMVSAEEVPVLVKKLMSGVSVSSKGRKALRRVAATESASLLRKFIQLHGLSVLKMYLKAYESKDNGMCAQVLSLLIKLPLSSRNPVVELKMEEAVEKFVEGGDAHLSMLAKSLVKQWADLPMAYKIPKKVVKEDLPESPLTATANESERPGSVTGSERKATQGTFDRKDGRHDSERRDSRSDMERRDSRQDTERRDSRQDTERRDSFAASLSSRRNRMYTSTYAAEKRRTSLYSTSSELTLNGTNVNAKAESFVKSKNPQPEMSRKNVNPQRDSSATTEEKKEEKKDFWKVVEEMSFYTFESEDESTVGTGVDGKASRSEKKTSEVDKSVRVQVSQIVVKCMSKQKDVLSGERFKHLARKWTHQILLKESKQGGRVEVDEVMKGKIKKYVYVKMKHEMDKG